MNYSVLEYFRKSMKEIRTMKKLDQENYQEKSEKPKLIFHNLKEG